MILVYLRRGLAAGLLAGLLAGLFALLVGEPFLERAIRLEEHSAGHGEQVFTRAEQKAGLILATSLYGTSVGALFGLASAFFKGRVSVHSEWGRSLALSGAIFIGAVLLPFLKYPPNPPGVSVDPETLGVRTLAYLAMVGLSLLAVVVAWRFARALDARTSTRLLAAGGVLIFSWTLLYLALPGFAVADAGAVPRGLLWGFRLSSLGTQAVLWAGIGCLFGLLGWRARRRGAL